MANIYFINRQLEKEIKESQERQKKRDIYLAKKKSEAKYFSVNNYDYGRLASREIESIFIQYGTIELNKDDYIIIKKENSPTIYLRVDKTRVYYTKKQATEHFCSLFKFSTRRKLGLSKIEIREQIDNIMDNGSLLYVRFVPE